MTIADQARNLAISLEAKKDTLSQRQSNDWKVSFTIQAVDMDPRFTQAPMGTRYAMVLVEIGDDELPVKRKEAMLNQTPNNREHNARPEPTSSPARAKRDWRDIHPSQQAGIRCEEPIFAAFLKENYSDEWHEAPDAPDCVRLICAVESRALLNEGAPRVIWHQLDSQFQAWQARERIGA